jgi:uncharacterized protein (DUF1697 family)
VNVGGRKVAMAEVREVLTELGYDEVRTYLQSGNAVFTAPTGKPGRLVAAIEPALAERFDLEVKVVLLTAAELDTVVSANPFPEVAAEPTKLVVNFLPVPLAPADTATVDLGELPERGERGERVVYLHYPNGQGQTKLTPAVLERRLGKQWGTARNWRTVLALQEMAAG